MIMMRKLQQLQYMKNQQLKNSSQNSLQYTRTKSKRRDLFENAAISRNLLSNTNQEQYIQQIKQPKKQQQKVIQQVKQNKVRQTQKPTKIDINWTQDEKIHKQTNAIEKQQKNKQDVKKQKSGGFIFQDDSQSQQQQKKVQTKQQNIPKKQQKPKQSPQSNNKIIFQHDNSSSQQQGNSNKANPSPTNKKPLQKISNKTTIQIFGQLVQVQVQQQGQQDKQLNESIPTQMQQINNNKISPSQSENKKQLLKSTSILPFNTFAKLKLLRDKTYSNGTIFTIYLQSNNRFILACKCISSQNYILSENPLYFQQHSPHYIGKIKTSFFGNQVNLFNTGYNPQKARQMGKSIRELICTVVTHPQQIMQQVKPRDFTVYMLKPGLSYYKNLYGTKIFQQEIPLNKLYQDYLINRDKIIVYENRKSKWNQKQKMHSLNMKGRAKLPSIKNYILQNTLQNGRQIMLFGKMNDNQFSFDIHHPLTPMIGMAIAISSFVHKSW